MIEGWKIIAPLEDLDFAAAVPENLVEQVCSDLAKLNEDIKATAVVTLNEHQKDKVASGLAGEYQASPDRLFRDYFSVPWSYKVSVPPRDTLDWKRAALLLHLALELAQHLLRELRATPKASVFTAELCCNPAAFALVYRHVALRGVVSAIRSAQREVDQFSGTLLGVLKDEAEGARPIVRGDPWPFDAETTFQQVLLGYLPTGTPGLVNSNPARSGIVAAGVIRTFLGSVIFRLDFESTLSRAARTEGKNWREAVRELENNGLLKPCERMWVTKLYEVLSRVVHEGTEVTYGEAWAFGNLVWRLRDRIAERDKTD